jgi:hypothetical protein
MDVRKSILRSDLRRQAAPALTFHQHSAVDGFGLFIRLSVIDGNQKAVSHY